MELLARVEIRIIALKDRNVFTVVVATVESFNSEENNCIVAIGVEEMPWFDDSLRGCADSNTIAMQLDKAIHLFLKRYE